MTDLFPSDLQQFVREEVASGGYHSEVDVVCAALRLLREREERLRALRREILPALDRLDRGEGLEFDDESLDSLFAQIQAEGDQQIQAERNAP